MNFRKSTTKRELADQLVRLGVQPGSIIMLHASLRKIGPVEGRAAGVIEAIIEVLGPQGTLMLVLSALPGVPFDAKTTPVDVADLGVMAEVFRNYPGVRVNDHAASRFAAIGLHAAELIDDPPLHDYFGPGSPVQRLTDTGGLVLRLGAHRDTITATHWAEYLADVPDKRTVRRKYQRVDTGEQWIECLDDSDGIRDWTGVDYFEQIFTEYLATGRVLRGPVGECEAELIDLQDYIPFAVGWLQRAFG